jgi:cytochrome P450
MGLPLEPLNPDQPKFTVLSYAAIDQILNDPEAFSNHSFDPTLGVVFGPILSVMDPPEHTRYRRVFQQAFRPPIVQSWGDGIVEPVIDDLMAGFVDRGRVELIGEFTRPYPFHVLYRMLGLPVEDIETFYRLTIAQLVTSFAMQSAQEAATKLGNYFQAMLEERRANPTTDVVSALAALEIDGEPFPEEVTIAFLRQLMSAGGETTFRSASVLFTGLLTHVDQLEALRADRSLVPAAIEEGLRWDGPVVTSTRLTTRDVVLDGVEVPAGAHLDVLFGSANHDPKVFERPDEFDIFRPKHRHFAFAFGIHNCIGQGLARLEMLRALTAFLDRMPGARLDPDAPPPVIRGAVMRIPRELHVIFDR